MTDSKAGAVQIFLLPQLVEALSSAPSVIQTDLFAFISRFSANPEEIPYKERKSQEVPESFRIFTQLRLERRCRGTRPGSSDHRPSQLDEGSV